MPEQAFVSFDFKVALSLREKQAEICVCKTSPNLGRNYSFCSEKKQNAWGRKFEKRHYQGSCRVIPSVNLNVSTKKMKTKDTLARRY